MTENRKISFAEKHPKLNLLIGFIIIIAIIIIAIYAIIGIINTVKELLNVVSNFDAVIIVALITGGVSIAGVVISSVISKLIEYKKSRQDYLAKKREEPYGDFVDMVYKLQQNSKGNMIYTEEEMQKDLSKFSKKITLWGSPRIVNKWVKFRENGSNPEAGIKNLFLLEEIMNDMRKDLGVNRVEKGNLLAFFVNDIKQTMKAMKKMMNKINM